MKHGATMNEDIDRVMNLLSKSGIIKPGQLHNLQMRVASDVTLKTVETFTKELVRQGHLTEFQALEVCRGKADQLMLGDYLLIDELGHLAFARRAHVRDARADALQHRLGARVAGVASAGHDGEGSQRGAFTAA